MSIFVEIDTSQVCLALKTNGNYWYGPAKIEVGEPFIRGADTFPFLVAPEHSFHIYGRSDRPLAEVLMADGLDGYLTSSESKGYSEGDKDLLCLRSRPSADRTRTYLDISVALSPAKFELLNGHLERLQMRPGVVGLSGQFYGFPNGGYLDESYPSRSEFEEGHPYPVWHDIEFSLRPKKPA